MINNNKNNHHKWISESVQFRSEYPEILWERRLFANMYIRDWPILVQWCRNILVNISSDNGLVPDGTKPLPEPVLIYR